MKAYGYVSLAEVRFCKLMADLFEFEGWPMTRELRQCGHAYPLGREAFYYDFLSQHRL